MSVLKLLVVDDEPGIRSGVLRILRNFKVDYPFMDEHFEFELYDAATGEEAKELIADNPPDIILLDNKLPGIQGVELLKDIKEQKLDITVVMITSYASLELAVEATKDGAYDFIPKPFTPQELRSSIENITKRVFLKRMTKQMKTEGKQVRYQFLSVLSHELKAPLNAVEGYINMMKERQLGEKIDDYTKMIDRSLERIAGMRNLILDLLDLTKIQSGKKAGNIQKVNPADIAKMAIDTMRPYAIQKNISMELDKQDNITLLTDPDNLEIIFNNLVSNAVKYNKKDGKVYVSIKETSSHAVIEVEDTGIGISDEDKEKLFNDFVRIKNEQTREISGSGLGLAIVKNLVDNMGGSVEVKSKPGEGSRFTVVIPLRNQNS